MVADEVRNLTDRAVMGNKSLLDIFRRIAIGTPGTAMPEFAEDLPTEDRWAVAAYVQAMQYGGSATAAIFVTPPPAAMPAAGLGA